MKTLPGKIIMFLASILFDAGIVCAQVWTQTSAINTNWSSLASSADGSILYASGGTTNYHVIFISTNHGTTWTPTTLPMTNSFFRLATSSDGSRVVAARNLPPNTSKTSTNITPFFISTNFGANWTATGDSTTNWTLFFTMSADGAVLIGGVESRALALKWVCISTNFGNTWTSTPLPSFYADTSVAESANGQKMFVLISTNVSSLPNCILTTTNIGQTWSTNVITPNYYWQSLASSADGNVLLAAGSYNSLRNTYACVSTNGGTSWTPQLLTSKMYSPGAVAVSADGSRLTLISHNDCIYFSTNTGMSWIQMDAPSTNWQTVISSADGGFLAACAGGSYTTTNGVGGIWTYTDTPQPLLNLASTTTDVILSWTIPSTNYVLQTSPDLMTGGWQNLTNAPATNLDNFRYLLALPLTGTNTFYRLKTQ
jgi:hypothetical protein